MQLLEGIYSLTAPTKTRDLSASYLPQINDELGCVARLISQTDKLRSWTSHYAE
jgi:hypothetical protein